MLLLLHPLPYSDGCQSGRRRKHTRVWCLNGKKCVKTLTIEDAKAIIQCQSHACLTILGAKCPDRIISLLTKVCNGNANDVWHIYPPHKPFRLFPRHDSYFLFRKAYHIRQFIGHWSKSLPIYLLE